LKKENEKETGAELVGQEKEMVELEGRPNAGKDRRANRGSRKRGGSDLYLSLV